MIPAPEALTSAAGNLVGVGSTLAEATAAAAGPTASVEAAAADEVSVALSQLFGSYGKQFQALSAQAATFHDEFVRLLKGGATAYLNTEIANVPNAAAATDQLLGGLIPTGPSGLSPITGGAPSGIFNGAGQQIGSVISSLISGNPGAILPGLFGPNQTGGSGPVVGPYQALFAHTNANLQTILGNWAAHPFPVLQQVINNQQGYAQLIATDIANTIQNLPARLQAAVQYAAAYDPVAATQAYIAKQAAYDHIVNTSLANAARELQANLPAFQSDLGTIGQSALTGDYHGAVHGVPRALIRLFLDGVELRNGQEVIVHGPAGELLPMMDVAAQRQQDLINLSPPGSVPRQMVQNLFDAVGVAMPSLGFALIGPPIATLDGLATGATALGTALQAGDGVGAIGGLLGMPAYVADGFLNGETVVDLTIPVTETVVISPFLTIGANTPVVVHLPFYGILAQPQPISATIHLPAVVTTIPITLSFGETEFGGLVPQLLTYIPLQVASAIAPN
ncbi:PE-PGRS family protein PE_PGRS30 [Mycobacterium simulans]|uniref:PE-PGRS family protein PE_PGRS30 n=1 Tax=Mycobacterium simulans TaxID=627089 RepID=A0A7Z7ILL7_9MYCO|nr:PE family protein [Mycobacterium simulans]SOJ55838.1 PE-PGRS family protein PE_PGRS30 [Mycobacterium simulans]